MTKRQSQKELLRRALWDAVGWQDGIADAYAHCKDATERKEALEQAKEYRRLLRKLYGEGQSRMERLCADAKLVSIHDLRGQENGNGETPDKGPRGKAESDN